MLDETSQSLSLLFTRMSLQLYSQTLDDCQDNASSAWSLHVHEMLTPLQAAALPGLPQHMHSNFKEKSEKHDSSFTELTLYLNIPKVWPKKPSATRNHTFPSIVGIQFGHRVKKMLSTTELRHTHSVLVVAGCDKTASNSTSRSMMHRLHRSALRLDQFAFAVFPRLPFFKRRAAQPMQCARARNVTSQNSNFLQRLSHLLAKGKKWIALQDQSPDPP